MKRILLVPVILLALTTAAPAGAASGGGSCPGTPTAASSGAWCYVRAAVSTTTGVRVAWSKLGASWAWRGGRITTYDCHLSATYSGSWRPRLVASSESVAPGRATCGRTVEWSAADGSKRCIRLGLTLTPRHGRYSWSAVRGECV